MTRTEAREVLDLLAAGVDPATGEVLPAHSPINHPRVIRALFVAAAALELAEGQTHPERESPANAGTPWREEEDHQLGASFDQGSPVAHLAKSHQRTVGAITSRLIRIGRLKINKSLP